jgi:lipopolysaccharide transport system ATP-binding protein
MSHNAIRVENVCKKYVLSHQRETQHRNYVALRDVIAEKLTSPWRSLASRFGRGGSTNDSNTNTPFVPHSEPNSPLLPPARARREDFWALKNVNFEIGEGEVVGVIGRNGAGKSTLLKILSRITEPTKGRIEIDGRVASLLEVGTGFHPELTGRENVYLNGAILGMTRVEIKRKFDEIVSFAEVEQFLDTPVKHYSSGMYVRLAFAVAAHLEPEILVVDEVLAVGDLEFQKKCLGKIQNVAREQGRTVLFVSHSMAAVTRLCRSAIWLHHGEIMQVGQATRVCSDYLNFGKADETVRTWADLHNAPGNRWVRLETVAITSDENNGSGFNITKPIRISLTYRVLDSGKVLIPNIHLYDEMGTLIMIAHDWFSGWRDKPKSTGRYRTTFIIPGNFLSEGRHIVRTAISSYRPFEVHLDENEVAAFMVIENGDENAARGDYAGHLPGAVRPILETRTETVS